MSETLGYILSTLVAGVVLFIIQSTTFRGQEAAVSTLQYRSVKNSAIELISMMDRDMRNVGSNFPYPHIPSELAVLAYDTVAVPHRFEFMAQTERGALPSTVLYTWEEGAPIESGGHTYPTFEIKRFVNGQLTGMNSGSITALSIVLLTAEGTGVMAAAETRQIKVDIKMVSSLGSSGHIRESRWTETFHPMHLAKQDGLGSS